MIAGSADVVVVGAGSAGCALAARLALDPSRRVTLIEAGGRDWNPLLRVPLMTGRLLRGRHANWAFRTEPVEGLGGRRLAWPRGRVLGGSSAINGMIWIRGLASDYARWAEATGAPHWNARSVFRAFDAIECGPDEAGEGPAQIVTRPGDAHPLAEAFLEAGRLAGHPVVDSFNAMAPEGFGRYDFTIRQGRRFSAARAFLAPLAGAPNLRIMTGARLLRVVVERGRAVGVEIARGRRVQRVPAAEVVLACGAVGSPQALMLSGIGPADALRRLGIPVVADLPGVGRNLQDHLLVRVEHACLEPATLHTLLRADRAAGALLRALLFGTGPAARFPLEAGALLRSDPALDEPDLQSHFLPGLSTAALRGPFSEGLGHGFFANVYRMRPESRGEIALGSADPREPPLIRPNYLAEPGDVAALVRGVRLLREVFAQAPFDRWRGAERAPGADVRSHAEIAAWARRAADTAYHPVGTCRMGRAEDPRSVVDPRLRVRGVEGLRIADASIMPAITSCNTQAAATMIGARAAAFIAEDAAEPSPAPASERLHVPA